MFSKEELKEKLCKAIDDSTTLVSYTVEPIEDQITGKIFTRLEMIVDSKMVKFKVK